MDKPTTKVVKSKSSNSAITTNIDRKHIKTRSNAEFQPRGLKKRGVYVEKKSKLGINEPGTNRLNMHLKPPPRPRPAKKLFLPSVLTILSKTTTGTQHPDTIENNTNKSENTKLKTKKKTKEKLETADKSIMGEIKTQKKKKFKSRVLNDKVDEQFVVLQSKKEIFNTPSLYSEKSQDEIFNLSDLPKLVKDTDSARYDLAKSIYSSMPASGIAKEVLEGKIKKPKMVKIEDPATLVSEQPKDEKGLYNFFVDLLETTFSVYNVKAEYNAAVEIPSDISTTRIALEIDESVANRLDISNDKEDVPVMFDDVTQKPSKHYYYIKNDSTNDWDDQQLLEHFQSKPMCSKSSKNELPLKAHRRRKLKSESFDYVKKIKQTSATQSAILTQKKSFSRKNKKKHLLSMFKEQLKIEADAFEEPQNLYQALKVIARTKSKCQKAIRFQYNSDDGYGKCMLKRRKLLSVRSKSSTKKQYTPESELLRSIRATTNSEMTKSRKKHPKSECTSIESESHHSLEVYGYDYEVDPDKKAVKRDKELVFAYHSSPSVSDQCCPTRAILKYADSESTVDCGEF